MVEPADDGTLIPVVMDFGLARQAGDSQGLTESGAVMGTPAYMSPEQARGDARRLDRRADVYSLGATLYDLIVGVPPFTDETIVGLLIKVIHDDPTPPRKWVPQLPVQLETIVMKCLAKEPGQRYDSAKDFAEDLERYLSGEPILGQKVSLSYRLRRRVLRNRALWAVSAASAVAILALVVVGLVQYTQKQRARRQTEARLTLERRLGQDIKEIEWLLRAAYELPLHDTAYEQELVRSRMAEIRSELPTIGAEGAGPVHHALGQGLVALHDEEAAIAELSKAQRTGYEPPELHYALGRARGALFQKRLEEARRSGEKTWVEKRRKELEAELLLPALSSLERSRGVKLQAPEYLEGLIALYRDRADEAREKAAAARKKQPWLYEAEELSGDAYAAQGLAAKSSGQTAAAKQALEAAVKHYELAATIGRSDGRLYEKAAEILLRISEIDRETGTPMEPTLERARALADQAITAAPRRATGYTKKAYALFFLTCVYGNTDRDPTALVQQLINISEQATAIDPTNGYAYDAMGDGLGCLGIYERAKGHDPIPIFAQAMDKLRKAAEVMPRFPWAYNDFGVAYINSLLERGKREPLADSDVRSAEKWILKATELDADYLYPLSNLAQLYTVVSTYQLNRGLDPRPSAELAINYAQSALARDPTLNAANSLISLNNINLAEFAIISGLNPNQFINEILSRAEAALKNNATNPDTYDQLEQARRLEAEYAVRQQRDPSASVAAGQEAARRCHALRQPAPDCLLTEVRLLLLQAEYVRSQNRSPKPILGKAWERVERAAAMVPHYFDLYVLRAELRRQRALARDLDEALARNLDEALARDLDKALARDLDKALARDLDKALARDLDEALLDVEKARSLEPQSARALVLKGRLHLAKLPTLPIARQAAEAAQADAAFTQAAAINPLLRRAYADEIAQARRLAGTAP